MTEAKQAWDDVADRFSELALKLKLHFQQAAQPTSDKESMRRALEGLREALDQAFTSVGTAVKDPAVKEDLVDVAHSLREAFSATFAEASDDLRAAFRGKDESPGS
jgi:hypothetical protein